MNKEGSRFSDGFLLGLLLGGAIVFLLGTDKGKKVLKLLTSEGGLALENVLRELDGEEPVKQVAHQRIKKEEPRIVDAEELSFSEHHMADSDNHASNGHTGVKRSPKASHRFFRAAKPL